VIADAKKLLLDGKALLIGSLPIDLVYNRLVDFALEEPTTRRAAGRLRWRQRCRDGPILARMHYSLTSEI